ncbi:MAG TPA: cysteine desulfurase [Gammaproteobacteria bacterium]|nr:cysteine desulfurase [Gammaproteobacteria bacterium]
MSTLIKEAAAPAFDVERVRRDFPILAATVRGKPLAYLDNAATTQKPQSVIDAIQQYYTHGNANVHRGVHLLSETATEAYEGARETIRRFINAANAHEIIFTRGTSESINLVAQSYGGDKFQPGDEIVLTALEHHSNIVPWQLIAQRTGAKLRVANINDAGEVDLAHFRSLFSERTRFAALGHVSNALGTVNPVEEMVAFAHEHGVPVLLDGAQALPHLPVDVQAIGCDFYAASGHKAFGPTGIGFLYGRESLLEAMPPWQGGGDMIRMVTFERTEYAGLPHKFEAGTPHIAGAIGFGTALEYLEQTSLDAIERYESDLLEYGTERLSDIDGLRLIGTARRKAGVLSFVMDRIHPHDLGTIVDRHGVAIRTGHHCAMPVMERFAVPATARASLAFYNTRAEIDTLCDALQSAKEVFA